MKNCLTERELNNQICERNASDKRNREEELAAYKLHHQTNINLYSHSDKEERKRIEGCKQNAALLMV